MTRQNATMLGGLPYMTPLRVTNPQTGRSVILYKRDIGAGQPLSSTLDGYHYRIDLTAWADQQLGLPGSGIVQVTRLIGPVSTPGGGQACSASSGFAPAGSGIDPIPGFTIGRDDMGVDASAPVGTPIYAPLDSQLVEVVRNWYAGQPLLLFRFLQPAGRARPRAYWYVAEQITPVSVTAGTIFRARQAVARFAPSGTWIEIGWGSPTSSGRTLAQQMGEARRRTRRPARQRPGGELQALLRHPLKEESRPMTRRADRSAAGRKGALIAEAGRARCRRLRRTVRCGKPCGQRRRARVDSRHRLSENVMRSWCPEAVAAAAAC